MFPGAPGRAVPPAIQRRVLGTSRRARRCWTRGRPQIVQRCALGSAAPPPPDVGVPWNELPNRRSRGPRPGRPSRPRSRSWWVPSGMSAPRSGRPLAPAVGPADVGSAGRHDCVGGPEDVTGQLLPVVTASQAAARQRRNLSSPSTVRRSRSPKMCWCTVWLNTLLTFTVVVMAPLCHFTPKLPCTVAYPSV